MEKGLTIEERDFVKQDLNLFRTCKNCNISKNYVKFESKKDSKGLWYFGYKCNQCHYRRKLEIHAENLTKYTDKQRYKENFTTEGRALMLRNRAKQRAKIYGHEFSLTKSHLINLLSKGICNKTGIQLIIDDSSYNPYSPSIDRIDSDKGYTDDNIQIVCMIYNFCKNKFTEEQVSDFFNKINK